MRVAATSLLIVIWLAACVQSSEPSAEACPGALLEGELLADDTDGFLVRHESGTVTAVVWPDGYTVRDGDDRELLDPEGRVAAREGEFVALGGGMTPDDAAFVVCGPFTVAPVR